MLIIAQNKLSIVNLSHCDCITISKISENNEKRSITVYSGDEETKIGIYPTEQRVIEVLDEICNAYISLNDKDRKGGFAYVKNGIYQMPEE